MTDMNTFPVLHAANVIVERDKRLILNKLTLSVPAGCVYALLGGNGAGKTTTLSLFLGFVQPSSGDVSVAGRVLQKNDQLVKRELAYLPENVALYAHLSGIENLIYFAALAGLAITTHEARELLAHVGLASHSHTQRIKGYSKGMRQKVGLAIAEAKHAKAILLDEPTSGLDPVAADEFAQRLRVQADAGIAVLMATHDLFNALEVADRIGILNHGRLVEQFDAHTVDHSALQRAYLDHAWHAS